MRATLLVLMLGVRTAACERTPPEEFPAHPPASVADVAASPGAPASAPPAVRNPLEGRCVRPTPAQAPPSVPPGPAPGCPADPEHPVAAPVLARVEFPEAGVDGKAVSVRAEVVRTDHDTQRGLMYRTSMAEDSGMLFDLKRREDHQFWMHNTCIPLDLLYVDQDGLIVGIVENAPTLDDQSRGVGCQSVYVLEVNAGWARRHGVKAGQRMTAIPPLHP